MGCHFSIPHHKSCLHRASQLLGCGCLPACSLKIHSQTEQAKGGRLRLWHKPLWCRSPTAFAAMKSQWKEQLNDYQFLFKFNLPTAPHFGGVWEREVHSNKAALPVAVGSQFISENVLSYSVLVEAEGILNSKPLGYLSTDVVDLDAITPNLLLMGQRDASLPQVAYALGEMGRCRWHHCQNLVEQFWTQFTRNYLPLLQSKSARQKLLTQ